MKRSEMAVPSNALFGDCLDVMHGMDSETVDLIYIDPPYYSQANYKGDSGSFSDKWESLHQYLNWMVVRLYEMKRLLKPTGSIYLHCDWHASHYLKVEMDKIMGGECFLNDVAWLYGLGGSSPRYWPRKHDSLLWYAKKAGKHYFAADMIPATSSRMAGEMKKAPDFWDIPAVNNMANERNGYPTQKPEALLDRVIRSSCPEGGTVADFFCGSGTTAAVAQRLGRKWIICDKSQDAINLATKRIYSLPNVSVLRTAHLVRRTEQRIVGSRFPVVLNN